MDLKCLYGRSSSRRFTFLVSKKTLFKSHIMYFTYFTISSLVILLCVCVFILRNSILPQTSMQHKINFKNEQVLKTNKKVHIPKYMLDLYKKGKDEKTKYKTTDIIRSLIPKHGGPFNTKKIIEEFENHFLIFQLPEIEKDENFLSAELRILTIIDNNKSTFALERFLKILVYDFSKKSYQKLQEFQIKHLNNTWLSFNVTRYVNQILQLDQVKEKILKIVISISTFLPYSQNNFWLSLMPLNDELEHEYPILLLSYSLKTYQQIEKRMKRSIEEDYEEDTNKIWSDDVNKRKKMRKNTCKRKPLYINFSEINFDLWIVQPPGYEAFQCQGKCYYPVAEHLNPTKHAIVQALLHSVSPSKVSRSCCVPTHLDSISILYVDNKGVLTYRFAYKDMVVLECGCR